MYPQQPVCTAPASERDGETLELRHAALKFIEGEELGTAEEPGRGEVKGVHGADAFAERVRIHQPKRFIQQLVEIRSRDLEHASLEVDLESCQTRVCFMAVDCVLV